MVQSHSIEAWHLFANIVLLILVVCLTPHDLQEGYIVMQQSNCPYIGVLLQPDPCSLFSTALIAMN